jgi:hypothetical protein
MLVNDIIEAYTTHREQMMLLSVIPYVGGFIIWVYFYWLPIRDGRLPVPFWLFTFWFAHDVTGAFWFASLADAHENFWFFRWTSNALFVWTIIEIIGMCIVIRFARQDVWGKYHSTAVTQKQAAFHVIAEIVVMFSVVNLLRVYMNDDVFFKWFSLTNAVLAIGPWYLLKERRSREGSSVALLTIIVIIVAQTFAPPGLGMFTTASPEFDTPWFYIAGVTFTALAVWNLMTLLRLPKQATVMAGKADQASFASA